MSDYEKEQLKILKRKLSEILHKIQWLIPEETFYKIFDDTLHFVGDYF